MDENRQGLTDIQANSGVRNFGIDLLRIVSMFMICILHTLGRGGILGGTMPFSKSYCILWFLEIAAYCAVNCYAMISGYVGVTSKRQKYSNLGILWLQVVFYGVIATTVFTLVYPQSFELKLIVRAIFPVFTDQYWYFTTYFLLFFLMPCLNAVLRHVDKKTMRNVLIILFILLSVFPTVFRKDVFCLNEGYSVLWLMVLYLGGGYFKLYEPLKNMKKRYCIVSFFCCIFCTWFAKLFLELITTKIFGEPKGGMLLISYTSPTMVIAGISLFMCFSRLHVKHGKKLIASLASVSFGVYLVHMQPLVADFVLSGAFSKFLDFHWTVLPFAVLGAAFCIYILCSCIDYIRLKLFDLFRLKKHFQKVENKIYSKHVTAMNDQL